MHNRALNRSTEDQLDIHVEGLGHWLASIIVHEPRTFSKVVRQIAKAAGLVVKDIRFSDDHEKINWREFGGRPAHDPQAPDEIERRMEDLLEYLRVKDNRRGYLYVINGLAELLDYQVAIALKTK